MPRPIHGWISILLMLVAAILLVHTVTSPESPLLRASSAAAQGCTPAPPGLVSWWPGDGNAQDIKSGNHGNTQGGTTFAAGKVQQAFALDGLDDFVLIPDNPDSGLDGMAHISIDAWFYATDLSPTPLSGFRSIVNKYNTFDDPSFPVSFYVGLSPSFGAGSELRVVFQSSITDYVAGQTLNAAIQPNTWNHVAGTWDGVALHLYVNGVDAPYSPLSIGSFTTVKNTNEPVRIGALKSQTTQGLGEFFAGRIDEVEIFNIGLTSSHVAAIFNAGSAGKCKVAPGANKIVFGRGALGGPGRIWSMNPDGGGQMQLTNTSAVDAEPTWSPDGTKILFTRALPRNWEIFRMNADGTGQTNVTNAPGLDTSSAWSPDGTKIAFVSFRDSGGGGEIYVMNADGSGQTRLTNHPAFDGFPSWSPDGTKITFTTGRHGNLEIYVMNADGSGLVRLTTVAGPDSEPSWSPDGTKIAFRSARDGNDEIYVMNADGSGQMRLTNNASPISDAFPDWSPDGMKIVFASNRDSPPPGANYEIYVMNADGSDQTRLTINPALDVFPDWG